MQCSHHNAREVYIRITYGTKSIIKQAYNFLPLASDLSQVNSNRPLLLFSSDRYPFHHPFDRSHLERDHPSIYNPSTYLVAFISPQLAPPPLILTRTTSTAHHNHTPNPPNMSSQRVRASSLSSNNSSSTSTSSPRPSPPAKRVSFDAISIPLPSATWEEFATPSTIATAPPFPFPEPITVTKRQRKSEIDTSVDLKAVLAQGIIEWRNEVDADAQ